MRRHHLALAAALLALSSPALADAPGAPGPAAPPPADPPAPQEGAAAGNLATLDGVVRAVDLAHHQVAIEVNGNPVVLHLDRNTLVYLPAGLSTVSALRPGDVVRAGRNAAFVAYWVQVRSSPAGGGAIPSAPGQGTGPGGGTAPPREGAGGGPPPGPPGRTPSAATPRSG